MSPFGRADRAGAPSEDEPWREPDDDLLPAVSPDSGRTLALTAQPVPLYHGETGRVVDDLKRWTGDGWRAVLVFDGHGPAKRAAEVLRDAGLGVRGGRHWTPRRPPGEILVATGGARARLHRRGEPARVHHRRRHQRRARLVHKGHAQDAEPAAQHDRPARAADR